MYDSRMQIRGNLELEMKGTAFETVFMCLYNVNYQKETTEGIS